MATILQVFGTNTALNVTGLSTLSDASTVASDEVDNTVSRHLSEDIQIELTGSGTGKVYVYLMRSNEAGLYPSTDIKNNLQPVMTIDMSASSPSGDERVEQLPAYYKYVFLNSSGAALTGATVKRQSVDLSNG